jgi:glutaredoxin
LNERAPRLTVYSRPWCHLCDDMIASLRILQADAAFELEIIDIDDDPALEALYGERGAGAGGGRQRALPLPAGPRQS